MVRIALLGIGNWGKRFVPEILKLGIKPLLCDISKEKLENFNLPNVLNYKDIDDVDAVLILTPDETHYEIAKYFLQKNVHVFVEKPFVLNSIHAKELSEIARKNKLVLMVGYIHRYNNALNYLKKIIKENGISVNKFEFYFLDKSTHKNSIIFDLGCHFLDTFHFLFGDFPNLKIKEKNYANIILEGFHKNISVFAQLSSIFNKKTRQVVICEDENKIVVDLLNQLYSSNSINFKKIPLPPNNTILDEINHFLNCIQGNEEPKTDINTACKIVEILEKLEKDGRFNI